MKNHFNKNILPKLAGLLSGIAMLLSFALPLSAAPAPMFACIEQYEEIIQDFLQKEEKAVYGLAMLNNDEIPDLIVGTYNDHSIDDNYGYTYEDVRIYSFFWEATANSSILYEYTDTPLRFNTLLYTPQSDTFLTYFHDGSPYSAGYSETATLDIYQMMGVMFKGVQLQGQRYTHSYTQEIADKTLTCSVNDKEMSYNAYCTAVKEQLDGKFTHELQLHPVKKGADMQFSQHFYAYVENAVCSRSILDISLSLLSEHEQDRAAFYGEQLPQNIQVRTDVTVDTVLQAYEDFLAKTADKYDPKTWKYALAYIDGDNIPELLVSLNKELASTEVQIYSYSTDAGVLFRSTLGSYGKLTYIPFQNRLFHSGTIANPQKLDGMMSVYGFKSAVTVAGLFDMDKQYIKTLVKSNEFPANYGFQLLNGRIAGLSETNYKTLLAAYQESMKAGQCFDINDEVTSFFYNPNITSNIQTRYRYTYPYISAHPMDTKEGIEEITDIMLSDAITVYQKIMRETLLTPHANDETPVYSLVHLNYDHIPELMIGIRNTTTGVYTCKDVYTYFWNTESKEGGVARFNPYLNMTFDNLYYLPYHGILFTEYTEHIDMPSNRMEDCHITYYFPGPSGTFWHEYEYVLAYKKNSADFNQALYYIPGSMTDYDTFSTAIKDISTTTYVQVDMRPINEEQVTLLPDRELTYDDNIFVTSHHLYQTLLEKPAAFQQQMETKNP